MGNNNISQGGQNGMGTFVSSILLRHQSRDGTRTSAGREAKWSGNEQIHGHAFTYSRHGGVLSGPSRGFVAIDMEQRYDAPGT